MRKRHLKKGYLFSLFVLTAMVLIALIYKNKVEFQNENKAEVFKKRVTAANMFVNDLEKDMDRSLYISGFRALLGVDEIIQKRKDYFPNVSRYLPEIVMNGTFNGTYVDVMANSSFGNWTRRMNELAGKFNIQINFSEVIIETRQVDPYFIEINFTAFISISDFEHILGWNYTTKHLATIAIDEAHFFYPVYYVESKRNNKAAAPLMNTIKRSPFVTLWQNDSGYINVTNLTEYMMYQYYVHNPNAPSYMMRLEGNLDCSTEPYTQACSLYGIESTVNVLNPSMLDIFLYSTNKEITCATDYQFFGAGCAGPDYHIYNYSDRLRLDFQHVNYHDLMNISQLVEPEEEAE